MPSLDEVTKTFGSPRLLILPKQLQLILYEMRQSTVNDLVFTNRTEDLLKYNAIQSAFNAGFIALKLPWLYAYMPSYICDISFDDDKKPFCCQASFGHFEQKTTQVYAKTVALLSSETGEKTTSLIFKENQLFRGNS